MVTKYLAWDCSVYGQPNVWPCDSLEAAVTLLCMGRSDELPSDPIAIEVVTDGFTERVIEGEELGAMLEAEDERRYAAFKAELTSRGKVEWLIVARTPVSYQGDALGAIVGWYVTRQEAEDNLEGMARRLGLIPGSRIEVESARPRETP